MRRSGSGQRRLLDREIGRRDHSPSAPLGRMSDPQPPPGRRRRFPAVLAKGSGNAAEILRPQRPLRERAGEAARQTQPQPAGVGLDSEAIRLRMVQRLAGQGIQSEPVLMAMAKVPRHLFVDSALAAQAYEETSLPIGHGQTISKPYVVARMLSLLLQGARALELGQPDRVLEIGTGCGYQAALLCLLSRRVVSIERLEPLHQQARARLAPWRAGGLTLIWGDGRQGHPAAAPYDGILAAAGGEDIPEAWLEQLAVGGRLVAPVRTNADGGQVLRVVDRTDRGWQTSTHDPVHFVPLKSGVS